MPPASHFNADTRPLPPGWKECFDAQQKVWYYQSDLVNPPLKSYEHPLDVAALKANTSVRSGMSFAQRLYASARVQQQSNMTQVMSSPFSDSTSPTTSTGYDNVSPPPLVQRERTPVPFAYRDEVPITPSDSTVYTMQSDRLAGFQRQSLTSPSHNAIPSNPGSVASSTVPYDSHGPPPAFSSSTLPPPVGPPEPPEWQGHSLNNSETDASGSTLQRRPTLPIYSPVAEEGISYSVPDDEMASLADGIDALNIVAGNSEPLPIGGHAEIVSPPRSDASGSHIHDDPPPAFSDLPTECGSSPSHPDPSIPNRALPTVTPTVLAGAATRTTATEWSPSVAVKNTANRKMLGPRPGPAAPHASASANRSSVDGIQGRQISEQASNTPRPSSNLNPTATPASRLSMNPSPRGIAAPVSRPPTESGAAAYARSLYASAVANAAHPIPAQQRSSQVVVNQHSHATSSTGSDPDASITQDRKHLTATGTPSASGAARAQSPLVIAPSPRLITSSVPQTQIQHLQAQAAGAIAAASSTPVSSTLSAAPNVLPSPPPLPQRRSAASGLAPTMRIERLSSDDPQSTVQLQAQGQTRPYRYSTAVVPASPVASTHSSNSGSSSSFSFFGSPASSSGTSSPWIDKTKKKTGGLLGMSSQKHKEMKRREDEERRARERAAAARAVATAQQEAAAGVVRRVPPPPPPVKPTTSAETTHTLPANIHSNPYVAAAYAQQAQAQPQAAQPALQSQTVQVQDVQTHPGMLQQQQPENATLMNILTGMNTGLNQANGRVQAGVSAALRQAGTVAGNVVNAASNALASNGSVAQQTQRDLDLFGGTSDFTEVPSFDQQADGLDVNAFADGQGSFNFGSFTGELDAGLSSFTNEGINALDSFNNSVLGDLPSEGLALNGLGQLDPSVLDFGTLDAGLDVSASTGVVQDGGFDMSSLIDALNFDADAQDTGLDEETLGAEGVYTTDDSVLAGETYRMDDSGAFDGTVTLNDSQFDGNEDWNAFVIESEVDATYGFAGEVPSDTFDSADAPSEALEANVEAPASEELDIGLDNDDLFQDYLDAQNFQLDQFGRDEDHQNEQNMQNVQDGQYSDSFEHQQDSQQDQVEAPQQTLEGQQELEQQQLQQQAKLEHRLQQQLNQQMRKSQAQAQALQQRLAQERRKQQLRYARLQAQLQMQAKQQADYLARLQQQQAELQQKLQYHFITQGPSQPDVVATFMEDLKKLQDEQTQAMMKLSQMHSNVGLGDAASGAGAGTNSGTGSATVAGGRPQAQGGTTAGHGRPQTSSPGNARPPRPAAGSNQQSAGGSGGHHVQAKPPANTAAPATRPQHTSPDGVQLQANTGNAASKPNHSHAKPVAAQSEPSSGHAAAAAPKPQVQGRPGAVNGNSSASVTSAAHNKINTGAAGASGDVNHSQTSQSAHAQPVARPHVGVAGQNVHSSPSTMASHATGSGTNHAHVQPSTAHVAPNATAGANTARPPVNSQLQHPTSVSRPTVASQVHVTPVPALSQVQTQQAKLLRIQHLQAQIKRLHLRQAQLQQAQAQAQAQGQVGDQNQNQQLQMQIQIQIQQLQRLLQVELGQTQALQQSGLSPQQQQVQPQLGQAHQFVQRPNLNLVQPNQPQLQQPNYLPQMQMQMQQQQQQQVQQQGTGASFTAGAQQELGRLAARAGVTIGGLVLGSVLAANNNQ